MGMFSSIGKLVGSAIGTAIGGPAGGAIGGKIGGAAGGLADKKKKPAAGAGAEQKEYIQQPSKVTMEDIRPGGASKAMEILSKRSAETKVASTAKLPDGTKSDILEDPWKPSRDWWEDLGGDPSRYGAIDDTRMP